MPGGLGRAVVSEIVLLQAQHGPSCRRRRTAQRHGVRCCLVGYRLASYSRGRVGRSGASRGRSFVGSAHLGAARDRHSRARAAAEAAPSLKHAPDSTVERLAACSALRLSFFVWKNARFPVTDTTRASPTGARYEMSDPSLSPPPPQADGVRLLGGAGSEKLQLVLFPPYVAFNLESRGVKVSNSSSNCTFQFWYL